MDWWNSCIEKSGVISNPGSPLSRRERRAEMKSVRMVELAVGCSACEFEAD